MPRQDEASRVSVDRAGVDASLPAKDAVRVAVTDLRKTFTRSSGEKVPAIDGISMEVQAGEFVVLLGASGCGKTTLLRCIAGLEEPQEGSIHLRGVDLNVCGPRGFVPAEDRRLGMVFQSYALWPHLTVADNVAYPLRSRGVKKKAAAARVAEVLEVMNLEMLSGQYPSQLSGGQQQRVALARAVVAGEDVILFDEPLSNVDAKVREHLRREIMKFQEALGFTALYVTHDQHEAMAMATRIAVLRDGRVEQMGSPSEVYSNPATRYVAEFIGTMNGLEAVVASRNGDRMTVRSWAGEFEVNARADDALGDEVLVVTRPQHWTIGSLEGDLALGGGIAATVRLSSYAGTHTEYIVECDGHGEVTVWDSSEHALAPGDRVVVVPPRRHVSVVTP